MCSLFTGLKKCSQSFWKSQYGKKPCGGDFASYTWDVRTALPDASVHTSTGKSFTHTLTTPGHYKIILTVGDANTCTSDPLTFEYYVLPTISVALSMNTNPTVYCVNDAATGTTITATGTTPANAVLGNATVGDYKWCLNHIFTLMQVPCFY